MSVGYIKLYRKIQESFLWDKSEVSKLQAWIDLIMMASYKDRTIMIRDHKINIKRGQLVFSQRTLSERWGWSRNKVERFLKVLEEENVIKPENIYVTTLITIFNYDKYQCNESTYEASEKPATEPDTGHLQDQQQGHPWSTNKELKNIKKEEESKEVLIQEKTPEDIQLEEANERLKAKRKAIEESRNPKTLEYSQEERTFTYQNNKFNLTTILANKFVDAMFKTRLTEYLTWYCQTFNKLPNQFELDVSLMQLAQNYTCYDAMLILQRNMKPDRKKIDVRDYESVTHRNRIEDEEND